MPASRQKRPGPGRPRVAERAGLPDMPPATASEVQELEGVLAYLDAQLRLASPRDAAPLLRQREKTATALRVARRAAKEAGEEAMTDEEAAALLVEQAGDRENGWPDAVAEAVFDALAERLGVRR
jgi:hypothetical protein